MATKAACNGEFAGEAEGAEFVLGEDPQFDLVLREELLECLQPHHGNLLTMIGMWPRPDINEGAACFPDLG